MCYIVRGDRLRIEAHVVNVKTGLLEVSDFVEGSQNAFFEMQTELAFKIAGHMDIRVIPEDHAIVAGGAGSSTIDALKLLLEAEDSGSAAGSSLEYPSEAPQSNRKDSLNGILHGAAQWLEARGLGS